MTAEHTQRNGAAQTDWDDINRRLERVRSAIEDLTEPGPERQQQILRERAVGLARIAIRAEPAVPAASSIEILEFISGGERYAFETEYVARVLPVCAITPIPGTPDFVVGIITAEGDVLSVVDLRSLLDLPINRLTEPTSIIVLKSDTMEFGILAEEVLGIERFPLESIDRELPKLTNIADTYLKGVSATRTAILDADQLLSDPRLVVETN
jgi:purine-binding chemotaxis protein CheW